MPRRAWRSFGQRRSRSFPPRLQYHDLRAQWELHGVPGPDLLSEKPLVVLEDAFGWGCLLSFSSWGATDMIYIGASSVCSVTGCYV